MKTCSHRSHFGSRYTLGCCDIAGLFATARSIRTPLSRLCESCQGRLSFPLSTCSALAASSGILDPHPRVVRHKSLSCAQSKRSDRMSTSTAVTVAILAQGTHWAAATPQAFLLPSALLEPRSRTLGIALLRTLATMRSKGEIVCCHRSQFDSNRAWGGCSPAGRCWPLLEASASTPCACITHHRHRHFGSRCTLSCWCARTPQGQPRGS